MTSPTQGSNSPHRLKALLVGSISLFSSVSLLASTLVQAQTPDAVDLAPSSAAPEPAADPASTPAAIAPPESVAPTPVGESAAPEAPEARSPSTAGIDSTEPYIDSTGYSLGATDRPEPAAPFQLPRSSGTAYAEPIVPSAPTSVEIGPIRIGETGLGLSTTVPSAKNFYNRTVRPPGLLGNGNISLIFPLSIPASITSAFGWRIHPIAGSSRFHSGTDIGAPMGTPVLAAYSGRVAMADFFGGYGLAVAIDHNKGTQQTLYGHLSEIFVKPGEEVKQGMVIGRVGSTGYSTGPHLHFEFRQLTPEGWAAMDAGQQLEYALSQLTRALQMGLSDASKLSGELAKRGMDLGYSAKLTLPLAPQAKLPSRVQPAQTVSLAQPDPRSLPQIVVDRQAPLTILQKLNAGKPARN